jgi:hypothetical protein
MQYLQGGYPLNLALIAVFLKIGLISSYDLTFRFIPNHTLPTKQAKKMTAYRLYPKTGYHMKEQIIQTTCDAN